MALHQIKKGLDLPIKGRPIQEVLKSPSSQEVAVLGHDYPTMKPRMLVQEGDQVKRGQKLFEDRKGESIFFTAPGAGTVKAIHRGEKRKFLSLVIELSEGEQAGEPGEDDLQVFESFEAGMLDSLEGEKARALLAESGMWTALRMRPFSRCPSIDDTCHSIFVTAIDTNPLAPSVEVVMEGQEEAFQDGLRVLSTLTEGAVFLCCGLKWRPEYDIERVQTEVFSGPHPAGLPGTHIHTLAPVGRKRTVWHIGYQDVIAIGKLFATGELSVERVISIAGPIVKEPCLVRTRLGASTKALTEGMLVDDVEARLISGSVLFGHNATEDALAFLNRYDYQISCLQEYRERELLGWLAPGFKVFSTVGAYLSSWLPSKQFGFTTSTHGSHRAMVPIGMFEKVMPLDVMPTFLLRSILVSDLERAEQLGCLELHEEDLALCSFVSPGKEDYGPALRSVLTEIWQEG